MFDTCKLDLLRLQQSFRIPAYCTKRELKSRTGKKRIGNYYYYLNDYIGSGYSSQVFMGHKNGDQETLYAIKVIRLSKITKTNYQLLQNQIHILGQLNHPNIIKLHEVYYTENNCYIITDYCEGGTLQNHIEFNPNLDWLQVFSQVMEGCQYLQKLLIIHRDIKPDNIFKKGNQWKIGDFGFARYVPHKAAQITEMYMIGSPLYMPLETLEKNIYSLKTDSFALGVLFYHIVTKQFPWSGNSKKEIIDNYINKKYPLEKIKHLPEHFQIYFTGLCQMEITNRFYISDYQQQKLKQSNFSLATQTTINSCEDLISEIAQEINLDVVQRVKLCKFIYYVDINTRNFSELEAVSENLKMFLKFLSLVFGWIDNQRYSGYVDQFRCRDYKQFNKIEQLTQFYSLLHISIDDLQGSSIRRCQILRLKLIQFMDIIRCLIDKNYSLIKSSIDRLVLHPDFSKVLISPSQLKQIQNLLQKYT